MDSEPRDVRVDWIESIFEEIDYICQLKITIMKIKYSIIFLGIILLSLFSCSDSKKKKNTDLEDFNLKGDVIFVSNDDGKSFTLYNEYGMTSRSFSSENGSSYSNTKTNFEKDKSINFIIKTNNKGKIDEVKAYYHYDSNGNLVLMEFPNNINETYKYDLEGNLITLTRNMNSIEKNKETNYYYTKNRLDSSIVKEFEYVTRRYHVDKKNTIKAMRYYNNKLIVTEDNKFNKNGDVIEKITTVLIPNPNNPTITKETYQYNYDSHGNWIQQITYNSDGNTSIVNRTIIYKGGDISPFLNKSDEIISSIDNKTTNEDNTESSDYNSQTESNDNSSSNTYQQPERQQQWVNCSYCRGKGEIACTKCNGTTLEFCGTCGGRGTFNGPQTCYYCKGALKVKCTNCNGKGNQGRCPRCGGRGQVQE